MTAEGGVGLVVIGGSWGGLSATTRIISRFPYGFPVPVILVLHQRQSPENRLADILVSRTDVSVVTPDDKDELKPGVLYVAPPGFHFLVNPDRTVGYCMGRPRHYSRPSIDETFFSVGHVYGSSALAVILTGANEDGAEGMRYIASRGGYTVVQSPDTAEARTMPEAAIAAGPVDRVVPVDAIGDMIVERVFGSRE